MDPLKVLIKFAYRKKQMGWTIELMQLKREGKIRTVQQAIRWFRRTFGREPRPGELLNIQRIMRE